MKRLFSMLAVFAIVMMAFTAVSCRSVKESSSVQQTRVSKEADSLVSKMKAESDDSIVYYRALVDSLISEMKTISSKYQSLYAKDSTMVNMYRKDSISVRDSSWSVINEDGTITHYKNTEKEKYSYQQLEKYKESILRESQHTIDSLIMENERIKNTNDSLLIVTSEYDSLMYWTMEKDSVDNDSASITIVEKAKTFWEKLKENIGATVIGIMAILLISLVVCFIYKKKQP